MIGIDRAIFGHSPTRSPMLLRFSAFALIGLMLAGCGDGRETLVIYSPHGKELLGTIESDRLAVVVGRQAEITLENRLLDIGQHFRFPR